MTRAAWRYTAITPDGTVCQRGAYTDKYRFAAVARRVYKNASGEEVIRPWQIHALSATAKFANRAVGLLRKRGYEALTISVAWEQIR